MTTGTVKVEDLHYTFNVRRQRDTDREEMFADLYKEGRKIPLIKVYRGTTEIHDGRHRWGALKLAGVKEVEVEFVNRSRDLAIQYATAISENLGGPKPISYADVQYAIRKLLEGDVSSRHIAHTFESRVGTTYTPSVIKRFIKGEEAAIQREKVEKATAAVAEGTYKVPEAEEKFGLKKGTLGRRISKKTAKSSGIDETKADITKRSQGNTRRTHTAISHLIDDFTDKKLKAPDVTAVISHARRLLAKAGESLDKLEVHFAEVGGPKPQTKAPRKRRRRRKARLNGKHASHASAREPRAHT